MTTKQWIATLVFAISIHACAVSLKSDLVGKWDAVEVKEQGELLEVNLSDVYLQFNENDRYLYSGTLNYKEAGTYHLEGPILYTRDTLNQSKEKAVEILRLSADSLFIKMKESGKIRLLTLVRE